MATQTTSDFMILGPAMASGEKVLDAVHALYFLPENFKLVLTGSKTVDQSFFSRIQELVERNELGHRVTFGEEPESVHAVVLSTWDVGRMPNWVTGDSPEALASAILQVSRAG